jgi:ElaB/YqjD/DUF883 family membrane-anchored ribosome-binding protein
MAKRGRPRKNKLDKVAVGIGRTLGRAAIRLAAWRQQGDEIAAEIYRVVETGNKMLSELGHSAGAGGRAVRKAVTEVRKSGRRPGFKMSAEARAKISAAQKKRWAKTKSAGK